MEPSLRSGNYVVTVSVSLLKPNVGDIVVIKVPGRDILMIKRISEIKKNRVYIIGDNEEHSTDSRYFGFVSSDRVVAKVLFRII
ncbi:MAG: S26 family signal peptidase [Candidatus Aenigmarchaeota archaeon]|nr:S26 family signal peptidase [Candidatus Aenigmarchaeota archaeon]